jgi:hypothetical protein
MKEEGMVGKRIFQSPHPPSAWERPWVHGSWFLRALVRAEGYECNQKPPQRSTTRTSTACSFFRDSLVLEVMSMKAFKNKIYLFFKTPEDPEALPLDVAQNAGPFFGPQASGPEHNGTSTAIRQRQLTARILRHTEQCRFRLYPLASSCCSDFPAGDVGRFRAACNAPRQPFVVF